MLSHSCYQMNRFGTHFFDLLFFISAVYLAVHFLTPEQKPCTQQAGLRNKRVKSTIPPCILEDGETWPDWANSKGEVVDNWRKRLKQTAEHASKCSQGSYQEALKFFFGPQITDNERSIL